jgi:hypothetical protein
MAFEFTVYLQSPVLFIVVTGNLKHLDRDNMFHFHLIRRISTVTSNSGNRQPLSLPDKNPSQTHRFVLATK